MLWSITNWNQCFEQNFMSRQKSNRPVNRGSMPYPRFGKVSIGQRTRLSKARPQKTHLKQKSAFIFRFKVGVIHSQPPSKKLAPKIFSFVCSPWKLVKKLSDVGPEVGLPFTRTRSCGRTPWGRCRCCSSSARCAECVHRGRTWKLRQREHSSAEEAMLSLTHLKTVVGTALTFSGALWNFL